MHVRCPICILIMFLSCSSSRCLVSSLGVSVVGLLCCEVVCMSVGLFDATFDGIIFASFCQFSCFIVSGHHIRFSNNCLLPIVIIFSAIWLSFLCFV